MCTLAPSLLRRTRLTQHTRARAQAVYLPESPKYESSVRHSQPEWSIFRTMNFGYNRLRANATHLEMRYYGHHRGTLHDEFVLKK